MRLSYNGVNAREIPCYNIDEALKKIEDGEVFRTNNFNVYYRLSKANIYTDKPLPEHLFAITTICVTSVTTKFTKLIQIIPSNNPADKLYFDFDLEKLILKELHLWGRTMNPEKLTGFGSKRFVSYLNAIPHDILSHKSFLKRAKKALSDGFASRKLKIDEAEIIADLAVKKLEKNYEDENAQRADANKKVANILKELG